MNDWLIIKTKRSKEFWAKENLVRQQDNYRINDITVVYRTTRQSPSTSQNS